MKKLTKLISILIAISFMLSVFAGCNQDLSGKDKAECLTITLVEGDEYRSTRTVGYKQYLDGPYREAPPSNSTLEKTTVRLEWTIDYAEGYTGDFLYLRVSPYEDFDDYEEYEMSAKKHDYYFNYEKIDRSATYYWNVSVIYGEKDPNTKRVVKGTEKTLRSETKSFKIADEVPRNYYLSSAKNCREMGGYPTNDDMVVKTGMLFRSANLDIIDSYTYDYLSEVLKIKNEIDLRIEKANGSCGFGGTYNYFPMESGSDYTGVWEGNKSYIIHNVEPIKKVFELLADENNYPIIYHCAIGTDRTGVIAFLVESLLDVKQEWLYRDYLLSNCSGQNRNAGTIDDYIAFINKNYVGSTLAEKTYDCLVKLVGLSRETLDSVISILKVPVQTENN